MSDLETAFQTLRQKDAEVGRLKSMIAKRDKTIAQLNKQIALMKQEHAREISELKGVVVDVTSDQDYMDLVIDLFAKSYGVRPEDITSKGRKRPLPQIRQMITHFLWYSNKSLSQTKIAHKIGYRDHTTVIYNIAEVDDWFSVPAMYKTELIHYEKVRNHIAYLRDSGELSTAKGRDQE